MTLFTSTSLKSSLRRAHIGTFIAFTFLAFIIFIALFPEAIAPFGALDTSVAVRQAPNWIHLFGTDASGRDVFSRVIYGAGTSLLIALTTVSFALMVSLIVGLVVSIFRGAQRFTAKTSDIMLAIPELLLALIVLAILGKGTFQVGVAVAVAVLPAYIRISLIRTREIMLSGFLTTSRQLGVPKWRGAFTHVLPNLLPRMLLMAVIGFGTSLVIASSLSFLGLGVQPPNPEWGAMLSEGRLELSRAWWISLFPGLMVMLTVLALAEVRNWLKRVIT